MLNSFVLIGSSIPQDKNSLVFPRAEKVCESCSGLTKWRRLSKLIYMVEMRRVKAQTWSCVAIFAVLLAISAFLLTRPLEADADSSEGEIVIVVDKKLNDLHITKRQAEGLVPFKTWHTTLGKVIGDKLIEGDKKTPEGIYDLLFRSLPSTGLKPKFGSMAIYVGYPNPIDRRGKQTGFDILIHGTDTPERLKENYDSEGCVVLANEQIDELWPYVKLKDTKLIITRDFAAIRNLPRRKQAEEFLNKWLKAWGDKRLDDYLDMYAYEFSYDKMDRIEYGKYKQKLNQAYETITVGASNVRYYPHEKYDIIAFDQSYESTLPGGKPGFKLTGRKNLYVQLRNGDYKIIAEELVR